MNGLINHIEIYVENLEETKEFYEWLLTKLGYKLFQDWKKEFSFKLDKMYIVFVEVENDYRSYGYHRKRIGLNHLAFSVDEKSLVDRITNELLDKNWGILYSGSHPYAGGEGHNAVYFEDPNRIKLEIQSIES